MTSGDGRGLGNGDEATRGRERKDETRMETRMETRRQALG